MIFSDAVCYIAAALALLLLPLDWVISACSAALIHELCHVLAVRAFGGRIRRIQLSVRGCMIESDPLGEVASGLSILAGPAGSLALVIFRRKAPLIAVCGLLQGLYNLLPVLPLDGGRILSLILNRFCQHHAEKIMHWIAITVSAVLFVCSAWLYFSGETGIMPVILALGFIIRLPAGKFPCKPPRIKVQ